MLRCCPGSKPTTRCAGPRLKVTAALHAELFHDVRFHLVGGRRRQRQDRRPGERARLVGIKRDTML